MALYPVVTAAGYDHIGPLWLDPSPLVVRDANDAIHRLLGHGPGDAPMGRVSVYVCAECGDLGCGALTVKLDLSETTVTWSDWGYQHNYDDTIQPVEAEALSDMTFDRAEYEEALQLLALTT
jgi:hypothetical protein